MQVSSLTNRLKPDTFGSPNYMKQSLHFLNRLAFPLNIVYAVILLLFIADCQPWFDIASKWLKTFVYGSVFLSIPVILIVNWRLYSNYFIAFVAVLGTTMLLLFSPVILLELSFSSGVWKTYGIEYVSVDSPGHTIERQVQDVGALGYNNRTIEVFHKNPVFMLVNETLPDTTKRENWEPVNLDFTHLYKKGL